MDKENESIEVESPEAEWIRLELEVKQLDYAITGAKNILSMLHSVEGAIAGTSAEEVMSMYRDISISTVERDKAEARQKFLEKFILDTKH